MRKEDALAARILAGEHPWHFSGAAEGYATLDVEEIDAPWPKGA
jgi:4-hydroxy-4-methyl-2-oxoglutarate aldolase